jgi:hypothetical protein
MMKWCMGVALTVGCLGVALAARAQEPLPEPLPVGMATVPYPGMGAPQCPPNTAADPVSLSPSIPGAFTDNPPEPDTGVYLNVGAMGLMREHLGHIPIAVIDRVNPSNLKNGHIPITPKFTVPVLDLHDIDPEMAWGPRFTLGYMWDSQAIEVSGFFVGDSVSSKGVDFPGRLFLFFNHTPLGFEGDNGMWIHADRAVETLFTSVGTGEVNYRWWSPEITEFEGIIGIRYADEMEDLKVFTGDDDLTVHDVNGNPDSKRQATYSVREHNKIVAPQLGMEGSLPLLPWLALSYVGKGAWGVNFLETNTALHRGDGLFGRANHRNDMFFAQVYEAGLFMDFSVLERLRIRAGYDMLWFGNIAQAADQIHYNLRPEFQSNFKIEKHSAYYHGPVIEVQLLF